MHVLHAISSIDPRDGGPPTALLGLASAQAASGMQVTVVSTYTRDGSQEPASRLTKNGVTVHLIGPVKGPLHRHPQLIPALDSSIATADVVHIHALWEAAQHYAARRALKQGKPYIIRPCGMLDPWSLSQGRLKKRIYMALRLRKNLNSAAAIHFTTNTERDLTAPLHLRAGAIVEPNGIDLGEFQTLPAAGLFRSKHPLIGSRPIVLFLGRLHHKKGLELLLPAFAKAAVGDAVLVVAGPDETDYTAILMKIAGELGMADRVLFVGMLKGIERIEAFVDAQLFVLPSYQENFGIAVVEAMAAGKAVLISDQVNLHDQITANALGGVVPLQVEAIAEKLRFWMSDPDRLTATGIKARKYALEQFDWRNIASRWATHYRQLKKLPDKPGETGKNLPDPF